MKTKSENGKQPKPTHFKADLQFSIVDTGSNGSFGSEDSKKQFARLVIESDFPTINIIMAKLNELENIDLVKVML